MKSYTRSLQKVEAWVTRFSCFWLSLV